jgi:antitoxin (DNA-binding transcriptional repressor) of toxin-antitoxin stability system
MTATLEQTQSDLLKLVHLVQQGEEIVITDQGRAVARLSPVPSVEATNNRRDWLDRLAGLREQLTTGKSGTSVDRILDEDRND